MSRVYQVKVADPVHDNGQFSVCLHHEFLCSNCYHEMKESGQYSIKTTWEASSLELDDGLLCDECSEPLNDDLDVI